METKVDEIAFAESEHKGGQHKFAELPSVCYPCWRQKKWKEALEDRLILKRLTGEWD